MTKTFRDLGVDDALCDALATDGITHPFPIQELTLPLALQGHDLIGQARTGTGKTLAFGLPLLQRLDPAKKVTQALVIVPTRELCLQVFDDLKIGADLGLTSIAVYGGVGYDEQIDALTTGVHVVVGTPGRLLDHLNRGNLDLSQVTQLVLDEADEMLDMGFLADVERLVEACTGEDRHTMLFSATMPTAIVKLARRYMDHPTFTRAESEAQDTAPLVEQHFLQVHRMDKPRVLARILQSPNRGGVYVFVRTKHMADRLVNELETLDIPSIPIHGDLRQTAREKNLDRFREGKATVLVCTEVAARGLDVSGVTHVINYDCPDDEKMYLHRIGRTARAGEAGVAVTFAEFNEVDRLNVIRKAVGASNAQVEAVFSTSEVLTELFDLPDEKPWAHLSKRSDAGARGSGRSSKERPADADRGGRGGRGSRSDRGDRSPSSGSRSDGGERARDGGSGGGRRKGSTDGRPKSDRRSEGTGGDHDATRSRAPEGSDRRPQDGAGDESATQRDPQRPSGSGRTRARGARPTSGRPAEAGPSSAGTEAAATSRTDSDTTDSDTTDRDTTDRVRTRTRTRAGEGAAGPGRSERTDPAEGDVGGADDAPDTGRSSGRQRARGGSRSSARRSQGGERSEPQAGSADRGDDGGSRDDRTEQRPRDDRRGGDRAKSRGGRSRRDNGGRGDGGGRTDGGARPRDDREPEPIKIEKRGRDARGEGEPQLARRVKVEHLP